MKPLNTASDSSAYSGFVADGWERAQIGAMPEILQEIEAKYADQLTSETWWQRWRARRAMHREICQRLEEVAPRDALY